MEGPVSYEQGSPVELRLSSRIQLNMNEGTGAERPPVFNRLNIIRKVLTLDPTGVPRS